VLCGFIQRALQQTATVDVAIAAAVAAAIATASTLCRRRCCCRTGVVCRLPSTPPRLHCRLKRSSFRGFVVLA
jgi:hypothetical protein